MANNCNSLKYVCLANCSLLTDNCLVALAEQCHQLNTLEVAGCSQFTDIGFLALSKVINYYTDFINVLFCITIIFCIDMSSYGKDGFRRMRIYYRLNSVPFSHGMP